MKSISLKVYVFLIIILSGLAAINVFLPQGSFLPVVPEKQLPAPKSILAILNALIMIVFYGGLGFLGLRLSRKLGFADIWDSAVSTKQRLLIPALIGAGIGIFFILADLIFSRFHSLGPLPHPPFPTSLIASAIAGIGEEIIFRLFFISFFVWLISFVIFKNKYQNLVFWIVSILSALIFGFGHFPSVMIILGLKSINQIPFSLMAEIILLNGILSLFAAYYFRKSGFLAAVSIHFWADIVWHVIWGAI